MSPALAHPEPAGSVLRVERGGLAPAPAKMSFYDLQNRFWQLHAECSFKPSDSHLYFYLLGQFNAARWPDKLYRKRNQLAAETGLDPQTLDAARARLEQRGLLTYVPGDKAKSAVWALADSGRMEGKISPQSDNRGANEGKNSPAFYHDSENRGRMEGKNSPQSDNRGANEGKNSPAFYHDSENRGRMEGKNSPLYKEEEDSREEEKTPPNDAASAAAQPEKKIGHDEVSHPALATDPGDASHTEGGAADVATSFPGGKPPTAAEAQAARFEAFWLVYPRHEAEEKARKAFARLPLDEQAQATELAPAFFARRQDWIAADGTDYRPYPATWLNQKRWKEAAEPLPTPTPKPAPTHASAQGTAARPGSARHHVPKVTSYGSLKRPS